MQSRRLVNNIVQSVKPLLNLTNSSVNLRGICNYSGTVSKLFSSLTRNDEIKNDFKMVSRNFASFKPIKNPFSSTAAIKPQDDKQNSNRKEMKPLPSLNLAFNPESKEFNLRVSDKKAMNESEKSSSVQTVSSGQTVSGFCSLCNATPCKFQRISSEENSNTIIIAVSKNELCRTVCKDFEEVSSTSSTQKVDKDDDYCPMCNAPKCKLLEEVQQTDDKNMKEIQSTEMSDVIEIKVNRTEICRQICNDTPTTEDKLMTSSSGAEDIDIKKSPTYCSVCRLAMCKYDTKNKISEPQNAIEYNKAEPQKAIEYNKAEPRKAIEYNKNSNSTSGNASDTISIIVDRSEICRLICKPNKTLTTTAFEKDKEVEDKTKNKDYCPLCDKPKCELIKDETVQTASKESKDETVQTASKESKDDTKNKDYCSLCKAPKCKILKDETV